MTPISTIFALAERQLERERDQLALWLPVGLGAGIALWFVLPAPLAWAGAGLAMAAVLGSALLFGQGWRLGQALAWFAGAMLVGLAIVWLKACWVAAPRLGDRPVVERFSARIEAVERIEARGLVRLRLAPDPGSGLPPLIRVNVDAKHLPDHVPTGSRIDLRARLMPPAGPPVPGGYDFARVAWFQGIGATGKALDPPALHPATEGGFRASLADARQRLSAHIDSRSTERPRAASRLPSSPAIRGRSRRRIMRLCARPGSRICCRCPGCT